MFDIKLIDLKLIVGNILACCEMDERMGMTDDLMQKYLDQLSKILLGDIVNIYTFGYTFDDLVNVCETYYSRNCTIDREKKVFRKKTLDGLNLSKINDELPLVYMLFIEAFTRWFIAHELKNDRHNFIDYTRAMYQSASMMMDCIR